MNWGEDDLDIRGPSTGKRSQVSIILLLLIATVVQRFASRQRKTGLLWLFQNDAPGVEKFNFSCEGDYSVVCAIFCD